ncbi:sigma D regulator [Erwinia sp. SLM-02]|uniref:sigma D regulator n=1 Tax=Erwinia sp. SLM-02 TaxID=3020057 RepID=UPI0028D08690|nr:sigma D regulator [uncultured Erwinia sp.]
MLNQLENLAARVGGCSELVDFCLLSRKQLLIAYYQMAGLKPNKESQAALDENALDNFCQSLVDYLSTGHFTAYERFIKELEGTQQLAQAALIYPSLRANTDHIMHIYDTYLEKAIETDNSVDFQRTLSLVGEVLAERFVLEDKFIKLALEKVAENQRTEDEAPLAPSA